MVIELGSIKIYYNILYFNKFQLLLTRLPHVAVFIYIYIYIYIYFKEEQNTKFVLSNGTPLWLEHTVHKV